MKGFVLVGTALAFRPGHRTRIDLDLFTDRDFDPPGLNEHLREVYGFSADFMAKNTLKGVLDGVALDLIAHKYDWVDEVSETDGIRLAGPKDIAAMKLNAIIGNGERVKDFVDVAFLGGAVDVQRMEEAFMAK